MADIVGTVKEINGTFEIVNENGEVITLQAGQTLELGNQIQGTIEEIDGRLQVVDAQGNILEEIDGQDIQINDNILNNGQEVIVNNQNPLLLDQAVTNNTPFTPEENTLDELEDLADETNLVAENTNDDTEDNTEDEVQSDGSKARELDRNGDIANVVADLREPVIDFREQEENIFGAEEIRVIEAKLSITGGVLVYEGNETQYTLSLTEVPSTDVVVTLSYSGVAIDGTDYTSVKVVTIPSGSKEFTFTIPTIDDYFSDNNEPYTIVIETADGGAYDSLVIDPAKDRVTTVIIDDTGTPNNPTDGLEVDQELVMIKLVALNTDGSPVLDASGNYTFANGVNEGSVAKYMAVAFEPGETVFKPSTQLTNQIGTVDVTFSDGISNPIANGTNVQTQTDGMQDFNNIAQSTVTLGEVITTSTYDDYVSDNSETFTISITDNTYAPDGNGGYENVVIDTTSVETTILDDSNPSTPNNPSDGLEENMESVTVRLVALDANDNILTDVNGDYVMANTVAEGDTASYMAILLDPSGDRITTATGNVTVEYSDGTAKIADLDYNSTTTQVVALNSVIDKATLDDYMSDNNETFTIKIQDDTYTKASDYENVIHNETPVVTTITDDTDTTPNDQSDNPVESNHEQVILKIVACDASGNPIMSGTSYTFANEVAEGSDAKYMVLAFQPGTTDFTTANVVAVQGGTVTIKTADITNKATGVTAQTTNDGEQDYILETTKPVTVGTAFDIETLNDFISDNDETYNVLINDGTYTHPSTPLYENVVTNLDPVTTNITDDPQEATIVLVAVDSSTTTIADITDANGKLIIDNTNATPESGKLYYIAVAVDADGKPLDTQDGKVDVAYGITTDATDKDATADTDYVDTFREATIGTVFEVFAEDDFYAEGDENFTVTITNPNSTPYENPVVDASNDMVTSTILDNEANKVKENPGDTPTTGTPNEPNTPEDPTGTYGEEDTVYVKITETPSTIEGGNLVHTVTLVDENGDVVEVPAGESVTVTLVYTAESSTGTGTFTEGDLSTIEKTVTITGGTNHEDFTNTSIDDFTAEGDEVYTVTITDVVQSGGFENVVISTTDNTTGTIKDGVTLGVPTNAAVDEDNYDMENSVTTITDTQSLNIVSPNGDNAYELLFDANIEAKDPDTNGVIALTSNGQNITFDYSVDGKITATRDGDSKKVFEITLNKNAVGGADDDYTYTQYENIDHPDANVDDDVVLTFGYKITDQGQTSSVQNFTVTVNDSLPSSTNQNVVLNEDSSTIIYISDESFANGVINLNNGVDASSDVANGASIDIYDTAKNDVVGSLTNNGDGTVTFTPNGDYSGETAGFTYDVSDGDGDTATAKVDITVKPVADAPTLADKTVTTWEDANTDDVDAEDGNQREGTNVKVLGLEIPVKKDQIDQNDGDVTDDSGTSLGDNPERLGAIEFSFATSGDFGTAAIGYDSNGDGVLDTKLQDITKTSEFTIDITDVANYHVSGTSGDYHLTKEQYESIAIMHDEDNAKNIKTKIAVASHEVQEDGTLYATDIVSSEASQIVTLDVKAVTDEISLEFNNDGGLGTISTVDNTGTGGNNDANNTITLTTVNEGSSTIDLKALLTKTSGLETDARGDLDGSEERSYTISGIPEGTIVTLGSNSVAAGADGTVTINFSDNTVEDPDFTMTISPQFSGAVSAIITLNVTDTDNDSTVTPETKTAEVYLDINVNPIADQVTLKVSQSQGDEDAGRTGSNDESINASDIDAPENGIVLNINVISDDNKDISIGGAVVDEKEEYNITIAKIPDGGSLYAWNNDSGEYVLVNESTDLSSYSDLSIVDNGLTWSITINDYQNDKLTKFIPPYNSDEDYIFDVKAQSFDDPEFSSIQTLQIDVTVDAVADVPVNDNLNEVGVNDDDGDAKTFTLVSTEDNGGIDLKGIFETPSDLDSNDLSTADGSETLTFKVTGLAAGFDIEGATFIGGTGENRIWLVDKTDLNAGTVTLQTPTHYAGQVNFEIQFVTTENAGDSKTHDVKHISAIITPITEGDIGTSDTQNEDESKVLNFNYITADTDGSDAGKESLESFSIDVTGLEAAGVTLVSNGVDLTTGKSGHQTVTVTNGVLETVTATLSEDIDTDYSFNISYDYKDVATDDAGNTYTDTKTVTNQLYSVTVNAITDDITLDMSTATGTNNNVDGSGNVTVSGNGSFTKTLTVTGIDSDGRGNADTDSSEEFTRVTVSGVHEGISVGGADGVYAGDTGGGNYSGFWYVDIPNQELDGPTTYDLIFDVNGSFSASDLGDSTVTVTAFNEDNNNGVEQNDSESFTLIIAEEFTGTTGTPAVIVDFYQDIDNDSTQDHSNSAMTDLDAYEGSVVREDTQFKLSDVVHVEIEDTNGGSNYFSITLKNVPEGVEIDGMTLNPQGFYTLSGNGNPTAVVTALQSILVTPKLDMNTGADNISGSDLAFDIELTTYATGAESNTALINFTASVLPLTDEMDLTVVNSGSTNEDTAHTFSITLDNEADGAKTTIIDGKVYLKLTETYSDDTGTDGTVGILTVDGKTMTVQNIDIGSGSQDYYVIESVNYDDTLNFTYAPAANRDGTITVDTYVKNQEAETWTTHNTDILTTHKQISFDVNSVIDGFTLAGSEISGTEDVLVPVGITLTSTDSSEKLSSVSLGGLADGFLLYYGAAIDGSDKSLANNLGTDGFTTMQMTYGVDETVDTNRWNIPLTDGNLPAYIWIATPENWSGTIPNLSVNAVDIYGNIFNETITSGTITPVVDSLTLNATKTFGNEGEDILLNLNANVEDLDGSETVTLTLVGFGDAEATFKANGLAINSNYDSSGDTYTISGIDVNDINALTVAHSEMASTTITTSIKMVESDGSESALVSDTFDIKISETIASSGDDTLLYTGDAIDANTGVDTLIFGGNINIDFDAISNISNIEKIDLTETGVDTITNLEIDDVISITDGNNLLEILGDSTDSVNLKNETGSTWEKTADDVSGFDMYSKSGDYSAVTLKIDQDIHTTIIL